MTAEQASSVRKRGLLGLLAVVVVGGIASAVWWYWHGRMFEETDDAYVAGDIVQVTSEVAGTVVGVHVNDTQSVKRGDLLVELDPADAKVALAAAEAELARAVRGARALFAQDGQVEAEIEERRTALAQAERNLSRRLSLEADGAVSGEEISHARDAVTQLRAALAAAQGQQRQVQAQTADTTVQTHPQVLAAETAVHNAALALKRTKLVAPVAGVVAKRAVQIGQRVAPGAPLMAVVPLSEVWVDANFKEVQLQSMRIGQPVILSADTYSGDVEFHGRIAGLGAGSGSAFALLPAQNASGNWIKIVQRVPVRIALDPAEVQRYPLRIGLSMDVRVDVRDTAGAPLGAGAPAPPVARTADVGDPEIDARIAQIVAANAGGGGTQPARAGPSAR